MYKKIIITISFAIVMVFQTLADKVVEGKAKMKRNPGVTVKCKGHRETCWESISVSILGEHWYRVTIFVGDPPFVFLTHEEPGLINTYTDPDTGEEVTVWYTPEVVEE